MQEPLEAEVPPGLLTIPQVAEYLGVCRAHVFSSVLYVNISIKRKKHYEQVIFKRTGESA